VALWAQEELRELRIFKRKFKEVRQSNLTIPGPSSLLTTPPPRPYLSPLSSLMLTSSPPRPYTSQGQVDRVVDEHTVICKSLFKPGTDMNLFVGMTVTLGEGGLVGTIHSTFGKTKFKCVTT
jgi:hypothetical protein